MKTLSALLLLVTLAIAACKSPEPGSTEAVDTSGIECICGQPEAQIEGCAHPLCVSGQGNPDNPDCLCGPLIHPDG
jgi:hypothetical protein